MSPHSRIGFVCRAGRGRQNRFNFFCRRIERVRQNLFNFIDTLRQSLAGATGLAHFLAYRFQLALQIAHIIAEH